MRLRITPAGTDPRIKLVVDILAAVLGMLIAVAVTFALSMTIHDRFCPRRAAGPPVIGEVVFDERGVDSCRWSPTMDRWICEGLFESCSKHPSDPVRRWVCQKTSP